MEHGNPVSWALRRKHAPADQRIQTECPRSAKQQWEKHYEKNQGQFVVPETISILIDHATAPQ
jgi:hypothetical protein